MLLKHEKDPESNRTLPGVWLVIPKPGEHGMTFKAWTQKHHQQYGCTKKNTPSPHDLGITGEWNTTSVPIQLCGTRDSSREAENRPDQGHKSLPDGTSTGSPWVGDRQTLPQSPENSSQDLRITVEWITTSVTIQL